MRNVSDDFLGLLGLASAGASGTEFSGTDINWDKTLHLATEQSVLPLLGCVLLRNPQITCPDEVREYISGSLHNISSMNMIRKQRILNLIQELRTAGFQIRVIKGYVIAESYAYPESRSSVDVDILIPPEQEKAVCDYLRGKGFIIEARSLTSHHTVCKHRKYGVVEVHVNLYDELVEEIWFQNQIKNLIREHGVDVAVTDGMIPTLGYTDHFLFLTLHMIKHFISDGMGLGMMLDIGLFYRKYQEYIDTDRYWKALDGLNYSTVIACVMRVLKEYGGFSELDCTRTQTITETQINLLLSDVETGGRMGINEQEARVDSAYAYNQLIMLKNGNKISYYSYMLRWKTKATVRAIFPTKEHLEMRYPYTQGKPLILPIAWLQRFIAGGMRGLMKDKTRSQIRTSVSELNEVSEKRLDLFRKLEML